MTALLPGRGPRIGFDLDMTLVDSRQGIVTTLASVLRGYGCTPDPEELWTYIGHPLELTLGRFVPPGEVEVAIAAYREEYLRTAVQVTTALPGARESLATVHALGGTVVVVSAKVASAIHAVLSHLGLVPDVVVGDLFGSAKGAALREYGVQVYVGDHVGDIAGARAAGAVAVAVLTGPNDRVQIEAAGADVVLTDLTALPAWLRAYAERARGDQICEPGDPCTD